MVMVAPDRGLPKIKLRANPLTGAVLVSAKLTEQPKIIVIKNIEITRNIMIIISLGMDSHKKVGGDSATPIPCGDTNISIFPTRVIVITREDTVNDGD